MSDFSAAEKRNRSKTYIQNLMKKPMMEEMKAEIGDLAETQEDLLTYIMFPQVAKKFLEDKKAGKVNL